MWRTEYHRGLCTYYMDLFRRRGDGAWRRSAEVHRQRAYSVEELTAWLAAAGFGDVRVYGDMRMRRPRAAAGLYQLCPQIKRPGTRADQKE